VMTAFSVTPCRLRLAAAREGGDSVRPCHAVGWSEGRMDSSELLQQLRIDRSEPVSRGTGAGLRIGAAAALLVAALLAVGAWWFLRPKPVVVDVATAVAPAADAATPLAVLQATGYVTARRQATVSAQI